MKNKLLVLLLLVIFSACEKKEIIAQIPDQPGFCLSDVLAITGGTCLSDAFTNSNAAYFDATYGSKDMNPQLLGGFRNYGTGTVPVAPVATAATNIENTSFKANWEAVSNATSYWLNISADINFTTQIVNSNVGNVLYYTVIDVLSNHAYYYRVKAVNVNGSSGWSNTINLTTDNWQMPNTNDLIAMYTNLYLNNIGGFSAAVYWSSVLCGGEFDYDALDFATNIGYCRHAGNSYRIRYIRVFNTGAVDTYNVGDAGPLGGWIFLEVYQGGIYIYEECTSVAEEFVSQHP